MERIGMNQTIQAVDVSHKTNIEKIFRFTILSIIGLFISIVTLAIASIAVFETLTLRQYSTEHESVNKEGEPINFIITKRYFADITNFDAYQSKIGVLPLFDGDKFNKLNEELDKEVNAAIESYSERVKSGKENNTLNADFVKTIENKYGVKIQLSKPQFKPIDNVDESTIEKPSIFQGHPNYLFTFVLAVTCALYIVAIALDFILGYILPNRIKNKKGINNVMGEVLGFFYSIVLLLILFKVVLMFDILYDMCHVMLHKMGFI